MYIQYYNTVTSYLYSIYNIHYGIYFISDLQSPTFCVQQHSTSPTRIKVKMKLPKNNPPDCVYNVHMETGDGEPKIQQFDNNQTEMDFKNLSTGKVDVFITTSCYRWNDANSEKKHIDLG